MMRVWGSPVLGNGHKRFTSSSLVTHTHTTQIPHIQTPPLPPKSSPSRPVYKAPYTTSKEDPSNLRKRIPPSSAPDSRSQRVLPTPQSPSLSFYPTGAPTSVVFGGKCPSATVRKCPSVTVSFPSRTACTTCSWLIASSVGATCRYFSGGKFKPRALKPLIFKAHRSCASAATASLSNPPR